MSNSRFKFPRRVRIHGGECDAVARALHHEAQKEALMPYEQFNNSLISDEKAFLSQADLKKSFGSTFNERKQMSTKTTFKRIALVAVSALGFGLMSYVPAANAAGRTATSITVGTIPAARVGEAVVVPVTIFLPAGTVNPDTITIVAQLTDAPLSGGVANAASAGRPANTTANNAGEIIDVTTTAGTALAGTNVNGRTDSAGTTIAGSSSTQSFWAASLQDEFVVTAAAAELGYVRVGVKLTPDVAGSYSVMVSTNATGNDGFVAGSPTANFTVTTSGTPTSVTITNVRGSSILAGSPNGALVRLTLNGALSNLEQICLTTSGNGQISSSVTSPSFATTQTLTSTNFATGSAHVLLRSNGTAAETISLTARGCGALSPNVTATSTYSVSAQAGGSATAATAQIATFEEPSADALYTQTTMAGTSTAGLTVAPTSTSQTFGLTYAARTATARGYATITDTNGIITGIPSARYDQIITFGASTAATGATFSVAGDFTAVGTGSGTYSVAIAQGGANFAGTATALSFTVNSAARTNSKFVLTPTNTTYLVAPGASITIAGELDDQFGVGRGGQEVTITTSGRNNPVATRVFTAADGTFSFTTADASTSTTNLIDTVSFTASGATPASITINYANTAVGTVTVTGGNTTASVTALTTSDNPISVGSSTAGAEAGAIDITATVRDASSNAIAGVPVTFSVVGDGVAFTTNTARVVTGSTGTAVGKLYAWKSGTYTYTVTAGGKTTTGTATFASTTATNARVVSATVAGNVVTGKVVDRFGNPVKGVKLYAVTTSPANIGGAFSTSGDTNAAGEVAWVVSGNGSVTVSAVNPADPAGTTFGQTCALAGNRTCATASTAAAAYAATVAGTATTAEKNVGASFAPAGVASVTVTVSAVDAAEAAADAAAEAIDAANAATDAANLAAEAADAATVAAEEARDAADAATAAVEELATQVATLMAALKAQITTLANTVAKIAKRVRA